ncbi:23S rRNA (adenine(2030)-N(6))-methyltransferase RlmJ [Paracoccus sp. p3-h83]|uniref:23S rRNA (adenine(2030)-N(6))-methyltransferase RlmJ n=1 Tax=Paracoccus sp. p3-h83 TaxID=3342805 RepID=UPI0035B8F461
MLSYQHLYHAGNLADLHKHAALAWMLDYLTRKDKPFSYLETHAGRGLYDLAAPEAIKTGEAAQGIRRATAGGWLPADHPLLRVLAQVRDQHGPSAYPGSPLIAALIARPQDHLTLAELHPREHDELARAMLPFQAVVKKVDGLAMAVAATPPTPRRGLMLIDPSYEVKADYDTLTRLVPQIARKWNVGIIALWYPILTSGAHRAMTDGLRAALPDITLHEVGFAPARPGHGMIGSGLAVVNPPFGFDDQAAMLTAMFRRHGGGR